MVSTELVIAYKQEVFGNRQETDQTINAKPSIFVVLETGLLFLDGTPDTVRMEDRLVSEKTLVPVLV